MPVQTRSQRRRLARAALTIQESVREHLSVRRHIDPITLDPVSKPVYRHVDTETNHVSYLNLEPLLDFLEATGDFRHPATRSRFHPAQVLALQHQAARDLPDRETRVFQDMQVLERRRKEELQMNSTLNLLVERLLALVSVGLEVCASIDLSHTEHIIMLGPWTCSVHVAADTLHGFLLSWEGGPSVEEVFGRLAQQSRDRIQAALSGPMYHSEMYARYVRQVVDTMFDAATLARERGQNIDQSDESADGYDYDDDGDGPVVQATFIGFS